MKRLPVSILLITMLASCSEPYDLDTRNQDRIYLSVEAILTDVPSVQTIKLSESISYTSGSSAPVVSGASVNVSDGSTVFTFTEREGTAGSYDSAPDFHCETGKTYTLNIECLLSDGTKGTYAAESAMPENGFRIDKIDYKQVKEPEDSTWVLGIWGQDKPQESYYIITTAVNGAISPVTSNMDRAVLLTDTFFSGSSASGYPAGYLYQNSEQYKKYGACAKVPETGDILSLVMYTIPKGFYDFMPSMSSSSGGLSVPILGSQPSNLPTNVQGGDATGYFATCAVNIVSCVVDDPSRREFL